MRKGMDSSVPKNATPKQLIALALRERVARTAGPGEGSFRRPADPDATFTISAHRDTSGVRARPGGPIEFGPWRKPWDFDWR